MLTGLELPFHAGDAHFAVSTSVGLTLFSGVGESIETVMQRANDALGAAKAAGHGQLCAA